MLTDLVQIRRLGENKRAENERFRRHIKQHSIPDRRLRQIAIGVESQIDCTSCANCCRVATVQLKERDVVKLARFLRITPAKFVQEYCVRSEEEGLILRREETGCVFLDGLDCTVYEARPSTCEYFPHMSRGEGSIASRMWQFIDHACYCPIVYNSLEAFKAVTKFRG